MDVPRLIASRNANKQIAALLSIGEETVKSHVMNILGKLGANDRFKAGNQVDPRKVVAPVPGFRRFNCVADFLGC